MKKTMTVCNACNKICDANQANGWIAISFFTLQVKLGVNAILQHADFCTRACMTNGINAAVDAATK